MTEETVILALRRDGYSLEHIGQFLEYHKVRPWLWQLVQHHVFKMIKEGAKRIGLKDVIELRQLQQKEAA